MCGHKREHNTIILLNVYSIKMTPNTYCCMHRPEHLSTVTRKKKKNMLCSRQQLTQNPQMVNEQSTKPVVSSVLNKTYVVLLKCSRIFVREQGKKDCKNQRRLKASRKQHFPDTRGQIHKWILSDYDSMHKACSSPNQI